MVKIYTKYNCVQCKMSKKLMDSLGIDYEAINVEDEPEYVDRLKSSGFKQLPVIEYDSELLFSGFNPAKIKSLVEATN